MYVDGYVFATSLRQNLLAEPGWGRDGGKLLIETHAAVSRLLISHLYNARTEQAGLSPIRLHHHSVATPTGFRDPVSGIPS